MVSVVEQELGLVDPKSVAYWQDTIGTVAALRERWPVVRSTAGDFEVLRYDDVERLLRDGRMHQALSAMLANQGITQPTAQQAFGSSLASSATSSPTARSISPTTASPPSTSSSPRFIPGFRRTAGR